MSFQTIISMILFQKVACSNCKAQYWIGWVEFDKADEYCPNCGEQGGLEVTEEEFTIVSKCSNFDCIHYAIKGSSCKQGFITISQDGHCQQQEKA